MGSVNNRGVVNSHTAGHYQNRHQVLALNSYFSSWKINRIVATSTMKSTLLTRCFLVLLPVATLASTESATVASKHFKAPNADTPSDIAAAWKQQDDELWSYVESKVPAVLDHTGASAFDEHLKGVQSVLRYWGAPQHLQKAGLFHSIYGTEGFQGFALPLTERPKIQELIGKEAEKLCWIFCMVDRSTVDKTVFDWKETVDSSARFTLSARPELGRFEMDLNKEEWLDFIELTLSDWLEQVEGASVKPSDLFLWKTGEAYAYRRKAYAKMAQLLAVERAGRLDTIAPRMLEQVMATESDATRHLVQHRTPPMSEAAAIALAALRSSGEAIALDLSPQPEPESSCDSE